VAAVGVFKQIGDECRLLLILRREGRDKVYDEGVGLESFIFCAGKANALADAGYGLFYHCIVPFL
jgi:hypothetical protein